MSEIQNIVLTDDGPVRIISGEYHSEPLLLEAGSERHVSIVLEARAQLHTTAFVLATGSTTRLSLTVDLAGEEAEFHFHALYIASDSGHADIDVRVNHLVPDCTSRQLIKGIAADTATGSFTGMVHVAQDARHTDASQRNQNLQLTDTAHVFTRPGLEIYADDVKCSHGASVGRLDQEAVYYMCQRGVPEAEARRMQMHGFANDIVNHCPSETSRTFIGDRIAGIVDRF